MRILSQRELKPTKSISGLQWERKKLNSGLPVAYYITDTTSIENRTMKSLLGHTLTKDWMTVYLAHKLLMHTHSENKSIVVVFQNNAMASKRTVDYLASSQKKADMKLILHAVECSMRGESSIDIFYQVFMHWLEQISHGTLLVKGKQLAGKHSLNVHPPFWKLFGVLVKTTFQMKKHWQSLNISSVISIPHRESIVMSAWFLFKKKQDQAERLPPTKATFHKALLRTHLSNIYMELWCYCKPSNAWPTWLWMGDDQRNNNG